MEDDAAPPPGVIERYHSLDALRAAMMLLGIVLHAMASYTPLPLGDAWPFRDPRTSSHFNLPLFVIHLFRMPAFFAMAGFFGALLYDRGGWRTLAVNRAKRVLLPFIIFWIALAPLVGGGFLFAIHQSTGTPIRELIAEGSETTPVTTMHLWFLHYLLIFYTVTIALLVVVPGRGPSARMCAGLTTSRFASLLWIAATWLTLVPMPFPGIETSALILPHVKTLVAYAVFFVFGWLLWRARSDLTRLARRWSSHFALGFLGVAGYILIEVGQPLKDPRPAHALACLATAVSTWGFVLGLTGAFVRFASREYRTIRYLSGAAYWTYLVHLPIVITAAGALTHAPLHAFGKFAIVLTVTTAACLLTYHYFVRATVIGVLLNGRRLERSARRDPFPAATTGP